MKWFNRKKKDPAKNIDKLILKNRKLKDDGKPYDLFWATQLTEKEFCEAVVNGKPFGFTT